MHLEATSLSPLSNNDNNNKLHYQIEKLIQKKVIFTENNWKANLAE